MLYNNTLQKFQAVSLDFKQVKNKYLSPIEQWDQRGKQKVLADWTARWKTEHRKLERVVQPGTDPGTRRNSQAIPEDTPPNKGVLELHSGLQKAESSVLVQSPDRPKGLAKFLYNCKVPGILSAQCRCRGWRGNATAHGAILHRGSRTPVRPPYAWQSQLPAANWDS